MNRRSLFAAVIAAPAMMASRAKAGGRVSRDRISTEKGDPGERRYAELSGDGKRVRVFLDGVEQKDAVTADPGLGIVKRAVVTENGNIAINKATGEIFYETVSGDVRVEVFEGTYWANHRKTDSGVVKIASV